MTLPGPRSIVQRLRPLMLAVAIVSVLAAGLIPTRPSFAKDVDIIGIVDCGVRSGQRCSLGDTLVLLTDSLSGEDEHVTIDIGWILDDLPALDQDDEITLSVDVLPGGKLRALSVISTTSRSGTMNPGLSTGSKDISEGRHDRRQDKDDDDDQQALLASLPPPGALVGVVRSLLTGAPIPGATVTLGSHSTVTDGSGAFSISPVDPGAYVAVASAPGFVTLTLPVTIASSATSQVTFALATGLPGLTITLTWGAQPTDLDIHLSGPATGGGRFHAFFLNPNPEPYASLTIQDDDGFGPEQVVIGQHPGTGDFVPGEYRIWIHNFQTTPELTVSQARVIVAQDGQLLGDFDVSAATGDPTLDLWHVVNLQVDAAGNVTVVPVQKFTTGDSLIILRPPYGPKGPRSRR